MKVLCFHHKGGVGKTTTAIHVTGVFLAGRNKEDKKNKVLLIDGDSQADSFKFFSEGCEPDWKGGDLITQDGFLTVLTKGRSPEKTTGLSRKVAKLVHGYSSHGFDHVVVDISADLPNIGNLLSEVAPDLVLLGVKRHDIGSFKNLKDMLVSIGQASLLDIRPKVKIIPIGVEESEFYQYIEDPPIVCEVVKPLPWVPEEAGKSVFLDYNYLWERSNCEEFWKYYNDVVTE